MIYIVFTMVKQKVKLNGSNQERTIICAKQSFEYCPSNDFSGLEIVLMCGIMLTGDVLILFQFVLLLI